MLYIILAILAGVFIVLSRIINFNLADRTGIFQGTFFNYAVGLFFSLVFFLVSSEELVLGTPSISTVPWWAFWGGFVGVIVVVLSTYLTPKLPAFYLTLFIFTGQLLVGGVIDFLLKETVSMGKIVGAIMVAAGLTYNLVLDRNSKNTEEKDASSSENKADLLT